MKKAMVFLAMIVMTGSAAAQLRGMDEYASSVNDLSEITFGTKHKLPNEYFLRFNRMDWTLSDMGDMITEARRILETNNVKFSDTFMDESDIDLSGDDYYDVYIMAMIMNGYSVMKAWAVETDNGEVYCMTLIMSFAGIQLEVREVK